MKLEPRGEHKSPTGMVRYAIWAWSDKSGEVLVPCGGIAALVSAARSSPESTCADRPRLAKHDAVKPILRRDGLIDNDDVLTEKGSVIAFFFARREGVRQGWETPHGHRRCDAF